MPWVRAKVRGTNVFARVDERGSLVGVGGRVEIRYQPRDGRLYRAVTSNILILDPTVLPEETCTPAAEVKRDAPTGVLAALGARSASSGKKSAPLEHLPTSPASNSALAYSDGACSGNPGPAGLGVVVLTELERLELSEYLGQGTNNVAELMAVLRAIEAVDPAVPLVVYTDSRYAIGVVQQGWKAKANTELVAALRRSIVGREVELRYVPGHAGIELNERADVLARQAVSSRSSERKTVQRSQPPGPATEG